MSSVPIKVAVRIRPFLQNENERSDSQNKNIFHVLQDNQLVIKPVVGCTGQGSTTEVKSYSFDYVFDSSSNQSQVFEAVQPLVDNFLKGFTSSVLAYGQTGSGKTYSMGISKELLSSDSNEIGIVPRAIKYIFEFLSSNQDKKQVEYEVTASFLELYNEDLVDLLDRPIKSFLPRPKPQIREENGVIFVSNIIEEKCSDPKSILQILQRGSQSRTTASTEMNDVSSRSHAIFTVTLKRKETSGLGAVLTTTSKFHFVDLAGSERLKKTGSDGDRKKEGISINQGLLALGNVISALGDESKKSTHIPYRDSKLTRLLQESLGGNSQTLMISCVSPIQNNYSESLATITYANRTRNIKNKISINQEWDAGASQHKEIKSLQELITKLQAETLVIQNELESVTNIKNNLQVQLKEKEEGAKMVNQDLVRTNSEKNEAGKLAELLSKKVQECEFTLATQSDSFVEMTRSLEENQLKIKDLEEKLLSTTRLQQVQLKRLEELSSEKAQIWMEKSSLSAKLSDQIREKSSLKKDYDLVVNDIKNKETLLSELTITNQALNNELIEEKNHFKEFAEKMSLERECLQDSLTDDLASQMVTTTMWHTKLDFAMTEICSLKAEREDMSAVASALKEKCNKLDQLNISNNSKLQEFTDEVELKNNELQRFENNLNLQKVKFENTIEWTQKEFSLLNQSHKELKSRFNIEINEFKDYLKLLETSMADKIEEAQNNLTLSRESCDHLKSELTQMAIHLSSVETALENDRKSFESAKLIYEERIANETREKSLQSSENQELKSKVEELEKEIYYLKSIHSAKSIEHNENTIQSLEHRKKRKSDVRSVDVDDIHLSDADDNEIPENPIKKVNLRKKKPLIENIEVMNAAKKSGGILSSIAVLMSNSSRQNSPIKGIRTRARAKAKELNTQVDQLKPKMPLKYMKQLIEKS